MLRPALALTAVVTGFVMAAACGGTTQPGAGGGPGSSSADGGGVESGPSDLPCDVDKVLADNCCKCHSATPQFGAPMPLMTWSNLDAQSVSDPTKKVRELIPLRIANDQNPMPPAPNARLGDADRRTLTDWVSGGAPHATTDCSTPTTPTPGEDGGTTSCTPNLTISPDSPYELPAEAGNQYVCWGVDLAKDPAQHITAFRASIDNTTITHHVVLFESDKAYPTTPAPCSGSASLRWRMVYGWAPGVKPLELPPDVGFPIASDPAAPTHYVVQMHYSNPQKLAGQKDKTAIEMCTEPPRKYEADVLAFGSTDFTIPPSGGTSTVDCSLTVPSFLAGLHVFAAMPHMHKLGVAMSTTLKPAAGGAEVDMGTDPNFSFSSQTWYPLDVTVGSGDVIRTKCSWVNNTGAPVHFGEFTADEMCYSFTMYYPKVQSSLWSWALPASGPPYGATCSGP